jgi:2-amino-4-hydroxy-6-hydroxymethyldihydropteridine diphosphokinase
MPSDPSNSNQKQSGPSHRAWISLGGNIPWRGLVGERLFSEALNALARGGFLARRASRVWIGPAWPDPADPVFYNAVVEGGWAGTPLQLLALLLDAETAFGRRRSVRNAPRTLDLDLLDFEGGRGRFDPDLEVPHPRLSVRPFILGPLADATPDWRHPALGKTARELYEVSENKAEYRPFSEKPLQLAEITANP